MTFAKREIGPTGVGVTEFGVGGGPFGNLMRPMSDEDARATLRAAWDSGFRYFDTAPVYGFGLSERRVGEAFRTVPREESVISTKVGRLLRPDATWHPFRKMFIDASPFRPDYDYSYDGVMRSYEDSRQRLGLERVDILYMHDISAETHGDALPPLFRTAMDGGYRAMDELRRNGDVKAIGLGVNEWEACDAAMDRGKWDVFLLAGRYTLLEQGPLDRFLPRCQRENVSVVIGAPLNSGILASGAVEGATYNYEPPPPEVFARVKGIEAVCQSYGVPIAAAAFQFPLTHPNVVSVIPGMASRAQLEWNVARMTQEIPPSLWADLKSQGLLRRDAPVPNDPVGPAAGPAGRAAALNA
jgi:D-threo-aldose 1-dehydrogenase